MGPAVELQRSVVSDHRVRCDSARQEEWVDLQILCGGAAGHDRVEAAPDVQQMSSADVLLEDRLARRGLARVTLSVRGREVLEPEHGVGGEVVDGFHVLAVRIRKAYKLCLLWVLTTSFRCAALAVSIHKGSKQCVYSG